MNDDGFVNVVTVSTVVLASTVVPALVVVTSLGPFDDIIAVVVEVSAVDRLVVVNNVVSGEVDLKVVDFAVVDVAVTVSVVCSEAVALASDEVQL